MINIINEYKTIKKKSSAEIVEKRSRFIATVIPVTTEEEAIWHLNELKQKYWDARHNVYAYILRENNIMRYSDDGEPSGTAGVPVLDILKKENLTDLIVVVTRYFGGILLGTGGLVHAYSKSAKEGIEAAGIKTMRLCRSFRLQCDYNLLGKLQYEVASFPDALMGEAVYGTEVEILVSVPCESEERFESYITDKTSAKVKVIKEDVEYTEYK